MKAKMDKDARERLRIAVKFAMNGKEELPEAVAVPLETVQPAGARHSFLKSYRESDTLWKHST